MQDIKIIHECLLDKTYNNKVEFELILDKIQDTKLVNGLLVDLCINGEYECNQEDIMLIGSTRLNNISNDDLFEANTYYKELLKEYNNNQKSQLVLIVNILNSILDLVDDKVAVEAKLREKLEPLSKHNLEYVKDYFLEKEWYDYIIIVNEYLNK